MDRTAIPELAANAPSGGWVRVWPHATSGGFRVTRFDEFGDEDWSWSYEHRLGSVWATSVSPLGDGRTLLSGTLMDERRGGGPGYRRFELLLDSDGAILECSDRFVSTYQASR